MMTREMHRFNSRKIRGMAVCGNADSAYRALAAIRDAAITAAMLTPTQATFHCIQLPPIQDKPTPQAVKELMWTLYEKSIRG